MSAMKRVLRVRDGLAITVGIVIGAGILRTPGLIAEYLGNGWLILISSGNANFLGMPRVAFGLARSGLAPKVFRYVSPRGTPVAGLLLIGIVILVLASTGALEFLIQFMMLVAISVDLMVLLAFFRLRRARPDPERPLRVPGGVWTAFSGLIVSWVHL